MLQSRSSELEAREPPRRLNPPSPGGFAFCSEAARIAEQIELRGFTVPEVEERLGWGNGRLGTLLAAKEDIPAEEGSPVEAGISVDEMLQILLAIELPVATFFHELYFPKPITAAEARQIAETLNRLVDVLVGKGLITAAEVAGAGPQPVALSPTSHGPA